MAPPFIQCFILFLIKLALSVEVELPTSLLAEPRTLDALALVQRYTQTELPNDVPPRIKMPSAEIPGKTLRKKVNFAIAFLKNNIQRREATIQACNQLNELALSNHLVVTTYVTDGAIDFTIYAMKEWQKEKTLQIACLQLITTAASWSVEAAEAIGKKKALEPVLDAVERFGGEEPWIITKAALLQHNCKLNQEKMIELGSLNIVKTLVDRYYNSDMEGAAQCFFSTACGFEDTTYQLWKTGYITRSLKAMQDFPHDKGIRDEILSVFSNCFLRDQKYLQEMVNEGIVTALTKTMANQFEGNTELDGSGPYHLIRSVMQIMSTLAMANTTWQSDLAEAGAIEQISAMISQVATRDPNPAENQNVENEICPNALNLGVPPVVLSTTCETLTSLMGSTKARDSTFQTGVLQTIKGMMVGDFIKYDPDAMTSCQYLEMFLEGHRGWEVPMPEARYSS